MLPHLYGQACNQGMQWGFEPLTSDVFSCEPFVCVEKNIDPSVENVKGLGERFSGDFRNA
jgi:hypothetical protein